MKLGSAFAACVCLAWPAAQAQHAPANRYADGSTPLQWAVYEGDHAAVRELLESGADVAAQNRFGATAMSLAAEVADTQMLEMLLASGADPDSANAEGQTALMAVARTGNLDAARVLLSHGAGVDARERWGGQTALMWAAARRHPAMIELLIENGAAVDARSIHRDYQRHVTAEGRAKNMDSGGFTALLYAARENCAECIDVLLRHGAQIDLPDPDGVSALLMAILNANWDLARQLIESGADVNFWNVYGEAPLFTAVRLQSRIDGGHTSIDPINRASGIDIVRLLLERGANPNMQLFFRPANVRGSTNTRGATPLIRAAGDGNREAVELLLEHGADPTLYMADRQTPIHAVLAGSTPERPALELIELLHAAGTDIDVVALVNHREEVRGGTAAHFAVRRRFMDVIRALAGWGIDLNAKDQDGLTALDYAQSRGFIPFLASQTPMYEPEAALLRELGATVELPNDPVWPVLGPPQGVWPDIFPIGEPRVHPPIYTHAGFN